MRTAMVRAACVPNGRAGPSPSAARTIVSFVSPNVVVVGAVEVVVGADVVVDASFLLLEQPAPAPARSTTDSTTRAARRGRMAVMAAHSSQWTPSTAVKTEYPAGGNVPVPHPRVDRRPRRRRPGGGRPRRRPPHDPAGGDQRRRPRRRRGPVPPRLRRRAAARPPRRRRRRRRDARPDPRRGRRPQPGGTQRPAGPG